MTILTNEQRRLLDTTVQRARVASETASADALRALAVAETHRPGYLDDQQNDLRLALRAKARQLGDHIAARDADITLLTRDVAYEQWHRLLFARFLERNGLLIHPDFPDTPLSLEDCEELATSGEVDEPDGWSVAARFAAQILPGVFRLDDPAVRIRLSTEHRLALERLLMSLPPEVFEAEDALGWVYQFWQTTEKKRVNEAGDKIGGADLSPVTQLFTENYMVRFLLENSLGAWWAVRHPNSPLVDEWKYLRRLEDGTPAAGTFPEWPTRASEVTVMDPCCGSGHFLVAMFGMLWRMRAEEEGLSPVEAQDAVLRDNLFGLELDPRCTQIATFNVALEAWKQGGYREIPTPQIACSGVPVRQSREEWLDGVPEHLREAMASLHTQFRHADTFGSLIDPRPAEGDELGSAMFGRDMRIGVTWDELRPHLAEKFTREGAAGSVLGHATQDIVQAAALLASRYTLIATNPPFLGRGYQESLLQDHGEQFFAASKHELATMMLERALSLVERGRGIAMVTPQGWLDRRRQAGFRHLTLECLDWRLIGRLGPRAFRSISGEVVNVILGIWNRGAQRAQNAFSLIDVTQGRNANEKAHSLLTEPPLRLTTPTISAGARDGILTPTDVSTLGDFCTTHQGIKTGDDPRFTRAFWELPQLTNGWVFLQSAPESTAPYSGRSRICFWEDGHGEMSIITQKGATFRGKSAWGQTGFIVGSGTLNSTMYTGEMFDGRGTVIVPNKNVHRGALWQFLRSEDFANAVKQLDSGLAAATSTIGRVQYSPISPDVEEVSDHFPEPHSDDPTQWLFKGDVSSSTQPLQVAVARLLGYRWPDQEPDDLDRLSDSDGIVTLPNIGEGDAASRLRELLAAAYGGRWSNALEHTLVAEAGGKTGRLEDWLRDEFFTNHCKVFNNRPFLWHVWDGRKDGFSAIVNYHRLDRPTLEKLTYTTLGTWIRRQQDAAATDVVGAEARLVAAEDLQHRLEAIIEGDDPYDVYVRWKPLHEQPIGWSPDLDDGVRLNIRPFITADVLRVNLSARIKWTKDRGKNPDGSDRHNDLHPTLAERREARALHEAGDG